MKRVLLLDSSFRPIKVISWTTAITMLFADKVDVIVTYPGEMIRSPSTEIKAPAVVKLRKYTDPNKKVIKFSRQNVYARDGYKCSYCGDKFNFKELTYDHVIPRSHGGPTSFTNIVSACYPCNSKKRNRTPQQSGMYPRVAPIKPKTLPVSPPLIDMNKAPDEWIGFLNLE